ncbi:hypothetical protein X559_2936 [Paenilisteria newyorkensis]|nr:hypothetical protein X559_2936 [Listeria newyorkensis]
MVSLLRRNRIKYFIAGHDKAFGSKQEASSQARRLGLNDNAVSMMFPRKQTENLIRGVYTQNLKGGDAHE